MGRFIDRATTLNLWNACRPEVVEFCARLKSKPQVEGVVILGGSADTGYRRFLDEFSDLDLAVFLSVPEASGWTDPKAFAQTHAHLIPDWLPNFQFVAEVAGRDFEVNVHELILEIEMHPQRRWPASKQEAYRYTGEIQFDRTGAVAELIQRKTALTELVDEVIVLAGQLPWTGWINPRRQLARGFPTNAKVLISDGLPMLTRLVFAANGQGWPHLKWMFEMAKDLSWAPADFKRLSRLVLTSDLTASALGAAADALELMGNETLERLGKMGVIPADPFRYASTYIDPDRQLPLRTAADAFVNRHGPHRSEDVLRREFGRMNWNLAQPATIQTGTADDR